MRHVTLAASLLFFCACTDSAPPGQDGPGRVATLLRGEVVFASSQIGLTTLRAIDRTSGASGAVLAELTLDEGVSAFEFDLGPVGGDVELEARNAFGAVVSRALADVEPAKTTEDVVVSPTTSLAHALAEFRVSEGQSWAGATSSAERDIYDHFGGLDHARLTPTSSVEDAEPESVARLFLEAWGLQAAFVESVGGSVSDAQALLDAYRRDLAADGLFDGLEGSSSIAIGGFTMDSLMLRDGFALQMESVVERTGLDPVLFEDLIREVRESEAAIFGPRPIADLDGPVWIETAVFDAEGDLVADGAAVRGRITVVAEAEDASGVESVGLVFRGAELEAQPGAGGVFTVETDQAPEGTAFMELTATDTAGNQTSATRSVVVDRTPPFVLLEAPELISNGATSLVITSSNAVELLVNRDGVEIARVPPTALSVSVPVTMDCPRESVFQVVARDAAGNASTDAASVRCDDRAPEIQILATPWAQEDSYTLTYSVDGTQLTYDTGGAVTETFRGDAAVVTIEKYFNRLDDIPGLNIPELRFAVNDALGQGVEVEYRYLVDGNQVRDWGELESAGSEPYRVSVSYQDLGAELVSAPPSALHTVELRASNSLGLTAYRTQSFRLNVLVPPVWVGDCGAAAGGLTATNFRDAHTEAGRVQPVTEMVVRQVVELPAGSGAPTDATEIRVEPPAASTHVLTAREAKFASGWNAGNGLPGPELQCGWVQPLLSATWRFECNTSNGRWHEIGPKGQAPVAYPGSAPSSRTAQLGSPINDARVHATAMTYSLPSGAAPMTAFGARLPRGNEMRAVVNVVEPRVAIGGVDWMMPLSPGTAPGYGPVDATPVGIPWLPPTYGYVGREVQGLSCTHELWLGPAVGGPPPPVSCVWAFRDVESFVHLETASVLVEAPTIVAEFLGRSVEVSVADSCTETQTLEVVR